MSSFLRSIRVRLTLLYSGVLFVVAALLVAGLYIGLSLSLRDQPLSQGGAIRATVPINDGSQTEERTFVDAQAFERQVNTRTLRNLRNFSLGALAALFVASLAVGWVILGGAALTRPYVEQDLAEVYEGEVRYARDAFEGLRLMDALINVKRGVPGAELPALRPRRVKPVGRPDATAPEDMPSRSDVATDNPVPEPPFWGSKVVKGVALQEYASLLDERATFMGQWGLKSSRASDGPSYEELVETEGRPRLRMWLERIQAEKMLEAAIVYGYYPVVSEGDDLVLLDAPSIDAAERYRFTFPRQRHGRHLCLADFFRPRSSPVRSTCSACSWSRWARGSPR